MADKSQRGIRKGGSAIALFAIAGGFIGLVVAFLAIVVSAGSMEADVLELKVRVFGHVLYRETGPPAVIDRQVRAWGWALFGGSVAAGTIIGAGIAVVARRMNKRAA